MRFQQIFNSLRTKFKSPAEFEIEAEEAIKQGEDLLSSERTDEAIVKFELAVALSPQLAKAHFCLGNSFALLNRLPEAISALEHAIQADPLYSAAHFNMGNLLLQLRQTEQAASAYQEVIRLDPEFTDAYVALGVLYEDGKQFEKAESCYRKALSLNPDYAEVHFNFGCLLKHIGQLEEAGDSFKKALSLKPTYADAFIALGSTLIDAGKSEEGTQLLAKAHSEFPDNPAIGNSLGNALRKQGRLLQALEIFEQCLSLDSKNVALHTDFGSLLCDMKRFDEGLAHYRNALEIDPEFSTARMNLGNEFKRRGDFERALEAYRKALDGSEDPASIYVNIGTVFEEQQKLPEAIAQYEKALELNPDFAEALNNLGVALIAKGEFQRAVECLQRAVALKQDFVEAYCMLGVALKETGRIEDALANLRRAITLKPSFLPAYNILLFIEHFYPREKSDPSVFETAVHFGKLAALQAERTERHLNIRDPARRLRIGFVSGDLLNHPVGYFFEGVLKALVSQSLHTMEIFVYSESFKSDNVTERIRHCCDSWRVVAGLSDKEIVATIQQDNIDILVDMSGHTSNNRLTAFAWKPAPIQVSWLGYFATTGVKEIDYLVADPWTLPPSEEKFFTEKIWRLPETRLCFTPPQANITLGELPALQSKTITFGCFNQLSKINDRVLRLWSRVLMAVPESKLFLKAKQLGDPKTAEETLNRLAAVGVPSQRVRLEGPSSRNEYLESYQHVDIALDPFPYTGGTTSAEALWMGVPVLTLRGHSMLELQGVGLLTNAGLDDWIAQDEEDYVAKAVTHAGNIPNLQLLRANLRASVLASPIFNAPRFAENLENAFREMWKIWCASNPPTTESTRQDL